MRLGTIATKVGQTAPIPASTEEAACKLGFTVDILTIDGRNNIASSLTSDQLADFDVVVVPPDAVLSFTKPK